MENKRISVVLVVHDQAALVEQNLPQFLTVASEADAEVIVVDDMSTDDTPDVLQRLRIEHEQLYTTFLPQSVVLNPSRLRLALNVGVKAAKGEYVVIADIHRPPISTEWLTGLADGEASLVYSSRKGDSVTHVVASSLEDLRGKILKTERKGDRERHSQWLKRWRGMYDAVSIRRERAIDLVRLFDQPVNSWGRAGLRIKG